MNQQELETFVAVVQSGSFSAAADQLHLTQPAVSKRVANLETTLNCLLFDRLGKRTIATEAGRHFLPQAQQILLTMTNAQRALSSLGRDPQTEPGELHLATSHHVGLHRLAPVLRRYHQRYPNVSLSIEFEDSEAAHELVQNTQVELAVVTLDPAGEAALATELIWRDPLLFVVAKDHPLTRRKRINLRELAQQPCILPGPATYTGRIATLTFSKVGLSLTPAMSTNYLETIGMLVSTGIGWSLLPKSMLNDQLQALPVELALERQLGVVLHPGRTLSGAATGFLKVLRETAEDS